jgi:hypothetical protein
MRNDVPSSVLILTVTRILVDYTLREREKKKRINVIPRNQPSNSHMKNVRPWNSASNYAHLEPIKTSHKCHLVYMDTPLQSGRTHGAF